MLEPVDGPDPYAEIADAVEWFRYVWCDGGDRLEPLARVCYPSPTRMMEAVTRIMAVEPPGLPADRRDLHRRCKAQIATPLFERYVAGVMGSV